MPASAEGEVRIGVPVEVDLLGVREHLGVVVGALDQHQDQFALLHQHVPEPDVGQRQPRQRVTDRQVHPEQLVDGAADHRGLGAQPLRQLGLLDQRDDRVQQERRGGDRARAEQRERHGGEQLVVDPVGDVRRAAQLGEPAEQAFGGRRVGVQPVPHVAEVLVPVRRGALEGRRAGDERQVDAGHQPAPVVGGYAEQPAVQGRRVRLGEAVAQVARRAVGDQRVEQPVRLRLQPALELLVGARREGLHDGVAQAGAVDVAHVVDHLGRDGQRVLPGHAGVGGVLEAEPVVLQHLLGERVAAHQPGLVAGHRADLGDGLLRTQPVRLLRQDVAAPGERERRFALGTRGHGGCS